MLKCEKIILRPWVDGEEGEVALWRRSDGIVWLTDDYMEEDTWFSKDVYKGFIVPYFYRESTPKDALLMGIAAERFDQIVGLASTANSMIDKIDKLQGLNSTLPIMDEHDGLILEALKVRISDTAWNRIKELAVYDPDVAQTRAGDEREASLKRLEREIGDTERHLKELKRTRALWLGGDNESSE